MAALMPAIAVSYWLLMLADLAWSRAWMTELVPALAIYGVEAVADTVMILAP